MPIEPLDATRFGFDSLCFVCDPANARGLRVPFFHDTDADVVFAEYEAPVELSGAPTLVHGGATLAFLDEAMAWATIAIGGKFAVTKEMSTTFDWPVRIGRTYRVEARIELSDDRRFVTSARVLDAKGRACVTAGATMVILDLGQAEEVIGSAPSGSDATYVRRDESGKNTAPTVPGPV